MFRSEKKIQTVVRRWIIGSLSQKSPQRFSYVGLGRVSSYIREKPDERKYCYESITTLPTLENFGALTCRNSRKLLQTFNPAINQTCFYHSVQCNLCFRQRTKKNLLSSPCSVSSAYTIKKRQLSLAWFSSLVDFQSEFFKSMSESQVVQEVMKGLQFIHDSLHVPWWLSIIISTVLLRGFVTFPLIVYQNYVIAKLHNLKPEMEASVRELKRESLLSVRMFGWTESYAKKRYYESLRKIRNELIVRENCHPAKTYIMLWVQIPLWISMSMAFRNMAFMMPHNDTAAQILFMELSTGGIAWIPNLTDVDHSLILPIAMAITSLIMIEVNALSKESKTRWQKFLTNFFRGVSIVLIPVAANMPSCVVLYWITSSVCGLVQNLLLMHPTVRQVCGIPKTPFDNPTPYRQMWRQLKYKWPQQQIKWPQQQNNWPELGRKGTQKKK